MKKLIALVMVLVLTAGVALAEQEAVTFDDKNPGYEGKWTELKDANLKFYLPTGYAPTPGYVAKTSENGVYTGLYMSPDLNTTFSLSRTPLTSITDSTSAPTLSSMLEMYKMSGNEDAAIVNMNGTDWVISSEAEQGSISCITIDQDVIYTVTFVTMKEDDREERMALGQQFIRSLTLLKK